MSPDAVTADRVYRELKRQIMVGELRPGAVLILSQIADSAGTSVSPVRDAILRMVGERLLEMQGGGGFAVPPLTHDRISCFYAWHGDLLRIIVRAINDPIEIGEFPVYDQGKTSDEHHHLANLADELFASLAACSHNPEHLHAVLALEARLHLIRIHENVLPRCLSELESLWNLVRSRNKHSIRTALWHYHRRRLLNVETIFSAMMKNGFIE
ncbi:MULTISPECIES: GntR family transcriptional regulator [Sphingobium]|uniref:GntR family transcriptional regulator n=1 Tax=Sphingobium TaxID=165695 RepID=UPI00077043FD|nr:MULTISPECIES: GntR family transcriptional regulator [Sphingomonadaceae]AMK25818.1 GntR family transcriptional regulator [Sphingobium sp. TKS]MEC6698574.1 GntR family transcriptional regulator [Sphingobium sp. SJ10-10]NML87713.1 GntR family transcriptional regulator [Sphingobium sp. TB-6]